MIAFWRKASPSQNIRLAIIFLILGLGAGKPVWSDNRIVFSAQYYKWVSGHYYGFDSRQNGTVLVSGEIIQPKEAYCHLYLAHQNGTHGIRMTSGPFDDISPSWSPDRTKIAFLRRNQAGEQDLCLVSMPSRRVSHLYRFADDISINYCWSPRGNLIAIVSMVNGSYGSPSISRLAVIDVSNNDRSKNEKKLAKVVLKIKGVREFAWSPDNRHLFMRHGNHRCEVFNLANNQSKSTPNLINPVWLNDHCILGIYHDPADPLLANQHFDVFDLNSDQCRKYNLVEDSPRNEDFREDPLDSFADDISWHRSPTSKAAFVMQVDWDMSDGEHSWCYTVTLGSFQGRAKSVGPCEFGGYSRHGTEYAIFSHEWVGPYKQPGGNRLGGLQVRSLSGRHTRWLTVKLTYIGGASWFGSGPTVVPDW